MLFKNKILLDILEPSYIKLYIFRFFTVSLLVYFLYLFLSYDLWILYSLFFVIQFILGFIGFSLMVLFALKNKKIFPCGKMLSNVHSKFMRISYKFVLFSINYDSLEFEKDLDQINTIKEKISNLYDNVIVFI